MTKTKNKLLNSALKLTTDEASVVAISIDPTRVIFFFREVLVCRCRKILHSNIYLMTLMGRTSDSTGIMYAIFGHQLFTSHSFPANQKKIFVYIL